MRTLSLCVSARADGDRAVLVDKPVTATFAQARELDALSEPLPTMPGPPGVPL